MVLLTGGTGFLGRTLLERLLRSGEQVRLLLHPNRRSPAMPTGQAIEAAVTSLTDARGVRAAMMGVERVVHLASGEGSSQEADLWKVDVEGTRNLLRAAAEVKAKRFVYLSHLGANPSSAYPLLKTKGLAEDLIRESDLSFAILRSAPAFGPEDRFTTSLAMLISISPLILLIPGDGSAAIQPIWVDDLVSCVNALIEQNGQPSGEYEVGGPEVLSIAHILQLLMGKIGARRLLVQTRQPYLRALLGLSSRLLREPLLTTHWIDYLVSSRTAGLDTLPRLFGLQPARMEERLDYISRKNWLREFTRRQFGR